MKQAVDQIHVKLKEMLEFKQAPIPSSFTLALQNLNNGGSNHTLEKETLQLSNMSKNGP